MEQNYLKKSKWPILTKFARKRLNFQTKSMSQDHHNFQICMQKLLKIGSLLFLIISVCSSFLQIKYISEKFRTE